METIGVLIAASEEMRYEKLVLVDLIVHLNKLLENRGIQLKPQVWTPEEKRSEEEFLHRLNGCEMCLNLYWQVLGDGAVNEMELAYERLKDGNTPRLLYIFFKEPSEQLSEALKDFKTSFATDYGHFFCKFENVDTMNLQFLLQLEATRDNFDNKLVEVKNEHVQINGESLVDLNKIPFACNNKEYKRLRHEMEELDRQIVAYRKQCSDSPDSNDLWEKQNELSNKRKELNKRFNDLQEKLYSVALQLTRMLKDNANERLEMAKSLFEKGDAEGADQILDLNLIAEEDERTAKLYKNIRESRIKILDEYCVKTEIVMLNYSLPFSKRFKDADTAYSRAIAITQELQLQPSFRLHKLYFKYAYFLDKYRGEGPDNREKAIQCNTKALEILKQINDPRLEARVALTILNQAVYLGRVGRDQESEQLNKEALQRYQMIEDMDLPVKKDYSSLLDNLGIEYQDKGLWDEAESFFKEALSVREELVQKTTNKKRSKDLYYTLINYADLKRARHQYPESEQLLQRALDISKDLFQYNAESYATLTPKALKSLALLRYDEGAYQEAERLYKQSVKLLSEAAKKYQQKEILAVLADTHRFLGILYQRQGQDLLPAGDYNEQALSYYQEACNIYRKLAVDNPAKYQALLPELLDGMAIIYAEQLNFEQAEPLFQEALAILEKEGSDSALQAQIKGNYDNMINNRNIYGKD